MSIKIEKLNFSYNKTPIFKGLNFNLYNNKKLSIIGPPSSGKTTLLKLLNKELEYNGIIELDGTIKVVYKNNYSSNKTIKEELLQANKETNLGELNIFFNINKIIDTKIDELNLNDRTLIKILKEALTYPEYLALDDLLIDLNKRTKILLLNYLNTKNILLINVTSDLEDTLYTDVILCLYNGISAIDGNTLEVLNNEKLLKRLGFNLPFMIDLSTQLKLYNLIDKTYLNKEEMVKNIWK